MASGCGIVGAGGGVDYGTGRIDDGQTTTRVHAAPDGIGQVATLGSDAGDEDGQIRTYTADIGQLLRGGGADDQAEVALGRALLGTVGPAADRRAVPGFPRR